MSEARDLFAGEERSFYLVRTRSGALQVRADPPVSGRTNISHEDTEFVSWLGLQGYESVYEWAASGAIRVDLATEACERCGEMGVEDHHWAERQLFGEEADDWPLGALCRKCHAEWHDVNDAWAEAMDLLTTNEDDPSSRRPMQALSAAELARAREVARVLDRIARSGRGKVSDQARYLRFRLVRLIKRSKPGDDP